MDTEKKEKYYTLATAATHELCAKLIDLYHSDLSNAEVKVDIVMIFRAPDGEAPAMEKDGHRILGKASVIKLKDRVKGMGDCEILLDGDAWENLPDKQKAALLDHELEHFEVKRDGAGAFVTDDLSRPVIKIRNHDRQFGWFDTVAQRHRSDSMEIHQLRKLFTEAGQIYLPFVDREGDLSAPPEDLVNKHLTTDGQTKVTVSVNGGPEIDVTKKLGSLKDRVSDRLKGKQ